MSKRRISGFKPTGRLQLGNYVGAVRPVVAGQHEPTVAFIADLHALTVRHDPAELRERSTEVAGLLLAAGVDPARTILYRQSDLPAHAELHYLLECVAGYGEVHRMIQFKEKGGGSGSRLSLLTYPVLMAADILLHDIAEVPVGRDQRQHVELTRDLAIRCNERYGPIFTVPEAVHPAVAARVADLATPTAKMGKTNASTAGVLFLLDPPDALRRKIMRAVTDDGTEVVHDPDRKPGVSNLLDILEACTGEPRRDFRGYGELKAAVADAVVATLEPIQRRYRELDEHDVEQVLRDGAERAAERADATVLRLRAALGLTAGRRARAGSPATPPTAGVPR